MEDKIGRTKWSVIFFWIFINYKKLELKLLYELHKKKDQARLGFLQDACCHGPSFSLFKNKMKQMNNYTTDSTVSKYIWKPWAKERITSKAQLA